MTRRATTVAEAQAQAIEVPSFKDWRRFAGTIDGYKIAEELGLDGRWIASQRQQWKETGRWELDLLRLRVMLFFIFRADYLTGWTYKEHDPYADSLMAAIAAAVDQPYTPKTEQNE